MSDSAQLEKFRLDCAISEAARGVHLEKFEQELILAAVAGMSADPMRRSDDIAKRAVAIKDAVLERLARNHLGLP